MHRILTALAVSTIGLAPLGGALTQSASAAPPPLSCGQPVGGLVTCTSSRVGETQFTVPAGVRALHVRLVGAPGGAGVFGYSTENDAGEVEEHWDPSPGGLGGEVQGDVNVGAGEQLFLTVGGRGQAGGFDPDATHSGLGGGNGGGAGGGQGNTRFRGGGGGGATDLRVARDGLTNRIMVAAGGGGGGAGAGYPVEGGDNDKAALLLGRQDPCGGGSGHTKRAGTGVVDGLPGGYGVGGDGSPSNENDYYAGGGGGGGYGGGGGGAETEGAGCGGGGGSSFFNARRYAVRGSSSTLWSTTAPPSVTVTYRLPTE
jgi:hypothetical protein